MNKDMELLIVRSQCNGRNCGSCPISKPCNSCRGAFTDHDDERHEAIQIIADFNRISLPSEGEAKRVNTEHDSVNHPSHYCREGGMESIDEMVLIFGKEAVKNFCLCNVWKYRYRASDKNGEEDLKKSDWYMRKYKELMGE